MTLSILSCVFSPLIPFLGIMPKTRRLQPPALVSVQSRPSQQSRPAGQAVSQGSQRHSTWSAWRPTVARPSSVTQSYSEGERPISDFFPQMIVGESRPLSDFEPIPGIIACTNKKSGRVYVGHSENVYFGAKFHHTTLKHGKHMCKALQDDFNYFGPKNFVWTVFESGPKYEDVIYRRKRKVRRLTWLGPKIAYNHYSNTWMRRKSSSSPRKITRK